MDETRLILFTLVLARVAGLTMTAPIYGTNDVPLHVRGLLAATLTMLIVPSQWHAAIQYPGNLVHYLVLLGGEAMIGICLGLGVLILVHGMTLAGELIAQTSGLKLSEVFDPALDQDVPLFSRLMFLVAVSAFVCLSGHRLVMAGLLDTFQTIPPGGAGFPTSVAKGFVTLVSLSFELGIRAAAPAVTSLLLASLILGLVGRTLPQLNVLSVGLGLNAMLTFAALGLTLGAATWAFQDQIQPALEIIFDALKTPLRTQWQG
jgi:flagellar biosynthetic protein FliR